jgi:transcriptional regulator with XRE-family HTH domain
MPKARIPRNPRGATPADVRIGNLIRAQRLSKELSQTELATAIGVTFQQVQKYEQGVNRVASSRLEHIAKVLDMSPSDFFDGARAARTELESLALVRSAASLRLLRAFNGIKSWQSRNAIIEIAEKMADK